ncbi:uncharacterized protein BYT42DRAFT_502659 [Radiomyces spectabilis]|uniref:uncharacterized protein n=1 Tax=Radiomyces spectabilis TaxID=64574 RepID=UPI00221F2D35|nr:uncharacterized protein BYT42DRAFT_502659 [Radiomyces spectabilis]KAI8370676.1 hypothetical protein BYT42DRAFT_502659 [Radiomyces spectabilis]
MAAENEKLEQADSPFPTLNDLVFEKKKKVVLLLSQGLLKCGCPCHRVEDTLQHTASSLGINASFSFLPDSVLITFSHPEDDSDTQSVMVKSPQSYDTGKIGQINRTMNSLHKDEMDIDTCITRLSEIMAAPPTCGFIATCLAFSLSAFSASALLFSGSWMDAGVSGALGLIVALLFILSNHYPIYGRVFEVSSSVIVALIARALHRYCCFTSVAVSAILILLPGYAMTMAVVELSARHVTTGTIRLVYSIVYAFVLAYGLQVGSSVYSAIDPSVSDQDTCANAVSPWFYIPLFPLLSISIALSFGSSHKQWPTQTFCAAIGFCLSYFLGHIIPDSQVVGSLASFAVGLYANFALKITGEAPLVPLCVGVTLLVPGSIGVRGAYALLHQDDLGHSLFPLQMLTIALGLSTGLFAAAMIVYPSGKKRSLYISF